MAQLAIKSIGNYHLLKADSQWARMNKYAFLVAFEAPGMAQPQILKGFKKTEMDLAQEYLFSKAQRGLEQKRFNEVQNSDRSQSMASCSPTDLSGRAKLISEGYNRVFERGGLEWFVKRCTMESHADLLARSRQKSTICQICKRAVRVWSEKRVGPVLVQTIDHGVAA